MALGVVLALLSWRCMAQEQAGPVRLRRLPDAAVPVNLYELLGPDAYARGVIWQPARCYAPLSERMDKAAGNATERLQTLDTLMMQELVAALAESLNISTTGLTRASSFLELYGIPGFNYDRFHNDEPYRRRAMRRPAADPRYWAWLRRLSVVAARYTPYDYDGEQGVLRMACPAAAVTALVGGRIDPVPGIACANASTLLGDVGLFLDANLRLDTVAERVLHEPGWCSVRPQYEPYGTWVKQELLRRSQKGARVQRFRDNPHKDRLMLMFDMLYEVEQAFKKQHWLGSVAQQSPFDGYAIMDIIHSLSPDLIIETGTANGGSALMWGSMLELTSPGRGRVVTIDVNEPTSLTAAWAGTAKRNATEHPLWHKYVTFIKGSTTDVRVVRKVRELASNVSGHVLVLLDSDHTEHHVTLEARSYCPLVTNGSYCIIQDTKLSRFSEVGGPTPAIWRFLSESPDFIQDQSREPFYTQHVGGYLLRVRTPGGAGAATGGWKMRRLLSARGGRGGAWAEWAEWLRKAWRPASGQ